MSGSQDQQKPAKRKKTDEERRDKDIKTNIRRRHEKFKAYTSIHPPLVKQSKHATAATSQKPVHKFAHLRGSRKDYLSVLKNERYPMATEDSLPLVGTRGLRDDVVFDVLKLKAMEYRRTQPPGFNGNFIILPAEFAEECAEDFPTMADRHYQEYATPLKKPGQYDKILILGSLPINPETKHGHICLFVLWFRGLNNGPNEIKLVTYDTDRKAKAENRYAEQLAGIVKWLAYKGYGQDDGYHVTIQHAIAQPHQHDLWNCGWYLVRFAEKIMFDQEPTEKNLPQLRIPDGEPMTWRMKDQLYCRGKRDARGRLTYPNLDRVTELSNDEKTEWSKMLVTTLTQPISSYIQNWNTSPVVVTQPSSPKSPSPPPKSPSPPPKSPPSQNDNAVPVKRVICISTSSDSSGYMLSPLTDSDNSRHR
jgi:hypothetical protein